MRARFDLWLPPGARALRGYRGRLLTRDLLAGATVAAVAVPQCMAVAQVAGMPPVIGLFRFEPVAWLWKVRKSGAVLAVLTTVGVLTIGVLPAVGRAIALAIVDLVRRAVRPHDAVLGRVEGIDGYHDITRYEDSEVEPGLIAYRFEAPLFFANAEHFREQVSELLESAHAPVKWFVLDAEAITDVDPTALRLLEHLQAELSRRGVTLVIARAKGPVRDMFARSGFDVRVGEDCFYPTVTSAVDAFRRRAPRPAHHT